MRQTGKRSELLPATALILGGGRGSRMGGNKLFLSTGEALLIERVLARITPWFSSVMLSIGPEDLEPLERGLGPVLERWPVEVVVDSAPGLGPLEGLSAALRAMKTKWGFAIGCDMPLIQEAVLGILWDARTPESDVVCARLEGFLEPLHAFYSVSCLPAVRKALEKGERRIKSFFGDVAVTVVEEENLRVLPGYRRSFTGVNTPEELRRLLNPGLP